MFVASERHGMAAVTAPQDGRRRVWNLTSLSARRSYTAFQAPSPLAPFTRLRHIPDHLGRYLSVIGQYPRICILC